MQEPTNDEIIELIMTLAEKFDVHTVDGIISELESGADVMHSG